jgi:hypothetical protein
MHFTIESVDKLELSSTVDFISPSAVTTWFTVSFNFSTMPVNSSGAFSPVLGLFSVSFSDLYTPISFSSVLTFFLKLKLASLSPTVPPSPWVSISRSLPGWGSEAFLITLISRGRTLLVVPSSCLMIIDLSEGSVPIITAFFFQTQLHQLQMHLLQRKLNYWFCS